MGLSDLFERRLPVNRKERYYTGTVFPAIVCADNFKYFQRFLGLIQGGDVNIDVSPDKANIQFFTEYGLYESLFGDKKVFLKEFFPDTQGTRDTPDILILIEGSLLIAIEAKMYDGLSRIDLIAQMKRQEIKILRPLKNRWPELRHFHLALLPEPMAQKFGALADASGAGSSSNFQVITWEQIRDTFCDVTSAQYFRDVLNIALLKYEILKSVGAHGQNADNKLTGEEILLRLTNNKCSYQTMGRQRGLEGLLSDIDQNTWSKREYEVAVSSEPANPNWFLISTFGELVQAKHTAKSDQ